MDYHSFVDFQDFKLPEEAFVPRHEIKDPCEAPKENGQESPTVSANETEANPPTNHVPKVNNEDVNWLLITKEVEIADLDVTDSIQNMLIYFAEQVGRK